MNLFHTNGIHLRTFHDNILFLFNKHMMLLNVNKYIVILHEITYWISNDLFNLIYIWFLKMIIINHCLYILVRSGINQNFDS